MHYSPRMSDQGARRCGGGESSWLTAAIPMDSPYCSCKLTRVRVRQGCVRRHLDAAAEGGRRRGGAGRGRAGGPAGWSLRGPGPRGTKLRPPKPPTPRTDTHSTYTHTHTHSCALRLVERCAQVCCCDRLDAAGVFPQATDVLVTNGTFTELLVCLAIAPLSMQRMWTMSQHDGRNRLGLLSQCRNAGLPGELHDRDGP